MELDGRTMVPVDESSHLRTHLYEVEEQLGKSGAVAYLIWVALWIVSLAVIAFATSFAGRFGF